VYIWEFERSLFSLRGRPPTRRSRHGIPYTSSLLLFLPFHRLTYARTKSTYFENRNGKIESANGFRHGFATLRDSRLPVRSERDARGRLTLTDGLRSIESTRRVSRAVIDSLRTRNIRSTSVARAKRGRTRGSGRDRTVGRGKKSRRDRIGDRVRREVFSWNYLLNA
jgi:hypothetical protein